MDAASLIELGIETGSVGEVGKQTDRTELTSIENLQGRNDTLEVALSSRRELEQQLAKLSQQLTNVAEMDRRLLETEGALQAKDKQIVEIQSALQAKHMQMVKIGSSLEAKNWKIVELEGMYNSVYNQLQAEKQLHNTVRSSLEAKDDQISQLKQENSELKKTISQLKERDSQYVRIEDRNRQLETVSTQLRHMQGLGLSDCNDEHLDELQRILGRSTEEVSREKQNRCNPDLSWHTIYRILSCRWERRQREEQEQYLCVVCVEDPKCIVFIPCGHMCSCANCAPSLAICPMCRADITIKQRVY